MPVLRSDLDGQLLQVPQVASIYLIDQGQKRLVPDPQTLVGLFGPNPTIGSDYSLPDIVTGPPISEGAVCAQATADVYLIDNGQKRLVASPAVMADYQFVWPAKQVPPLVVPPILLEFIPTGPTVNPPTAASPAAARQSAAAAV